MKLKLSLRKLMTFKECGILMILLIILAGCKPAKFIYTNKEIQSPDESQSIAECIKESGNISNGYFLIDSKKSIIRIKKNKGDNRYYLHLKGDPYVLPIEITCNYLNLKIYDDEEVLFSDTISKQISIVRNKYNKEKPFNIGRDKFVVRNHWGTVCEYKADGSLDFCIHRKYVYELDSIGEINKTFLN